MAAVSTAPEFHLEGFDNESSVVLDDNLLIVIDNDSPTDVLASNSISKSSCDSKDEITGSCAVSKNDNQNEVDCDGRAVTSAVPLEESACSPESRDTYDEKLSLFRVKLDSNATIVPAELLHKVTDLVAKSPGSIDDVRLEAEHVDSPVETNSPLSPCLEEGTSREKRKHRKKYKKKTDTRTSAEVKKSDDVGKSSDIGKTADAKKLDDVEKSDDVRKSSNRRDTTRPKRIAPNHFVAVQITNKEIHKKIDEIQNTVVTKEALLRDAFVNLPTLHLTMMVMCLKDDEQIARAKAAMDICKERIVQGNVCSGSSNGTVQLPIAGIGDFDGKIVFAKVKDGPELNCLKQVAEIVRQSFAEHDLISTDDRGFQAHLTIMKLSKSPWLFKKLKKIDQKLYANLKDDFLGLQPLVSLQLCSMERADNCYYPVLHEVGLEPENVT